VTIPAAVSLTLTAFAPAVVINTGDELTPDVALLSLVTYAPVLKLSVQAATLTIAVTTFAPVARIAGISHPHRTYVIQSRNYMLEVGAPNREYVVGAFDYETEYELV
jgi:hypothetical protein